MGSDALRRAVAGRVRTGGSLSGGIARVAVPLAICLAVVVAGFAVHGAPRRAGVDPTIGLLLFGVVGLAARGDSGNAIERLTNKIERFQAGEPVDFSTDRDDEVGDLYEAVDEMATSARERERELRERERYRRQLYEITSDPDLDGDEKIRQLLELGRERLGVENGHVVEIDRETGRHRVLEASGSDLVERGAETDLEETYCRETIDSDGRLAVSDAAEQGWEDDPARERWGIGCYLGGTIEVDGELFGTLCFVDEDPREEEFTQDEKSIVDTMSRWLSAELGRRDHEETLREEKEAFRHLVEDVEEYAIFMLDPDGRVQSWNRGAEKIKGYEREEILGEHVSTFYTEEDVERGVPERNLERARTEGSVEDEGWRVRDDGSRFWANVTITALEDDDGTLRGFAKVTRDMSERREYERELEAERDRFSALFENTPNEVVRVELADDDVFVRSVNEQFADTFGYEEDEILGESLIDRIVPSDFREKLEDLKQRALDGDHLSYDAKRQTADGERLFHVQFIPIGGDGEHVTEAYAVYTDITERREYERELEAIVQNTISAIYIKDDDGAYQFVNEATADFFGMDAADVVGKTDAELFDAETVAEIREHDERVKESGETLAEEVVRPVDGEDRVFLDNKFPYRDENGEIVGIMGVSRDITERKERERELRETKRRLEIALEGTNTGIWEWDLETDEVTWNRTLERFLGLDPGAFDETYEAFEERIHPDDRAAVEAALDRAIEDDELYQAEFRMRHEDGDWRWIGARGRVVSRESGGRRILGIHNDITGRKERERELRESERRFEAVFNDPNILMALLDPDGNVLDVNETAMEYVDAEPSDVTREPFWEGPWWDEDTADDAREWVERAAAGEYVDFEAELARPDGSWYAVDGVFRPVTNDDGDVVSIVVSDRDVTARKERERRLEEYKQYTDDILDAIDDVFYVLDAEGDLLRWNESHVEATGFSHEEAAEMDALAFFADEDRDDIADAIEEAFETGDTRVEAPYLTKDGESVPYEFVASRLENPDGEPVIAGIGRDISRRVEKERELSRLISNVPGFVYRAENDPDWPFRFVSEGVRDITGYDAEQLESGEVSYGVDLIAERGDEIWADVQAALDDREPFNLTYAIETADGERRWVKELGRGVYASDGALDGVEGVIIDITERIEYEQELERTRELLEHAQRIGDIGGWELDVTTDPPELTATEEAYRIHQLPPSGNIGYEDAIEFYHPDDRDRIQSAVQRAIEQREGYDVEAKFVTAEGNEIWVRSIAEPVVENGEVTKLRGSIQDITDRKERERELRETKERMQKFIEASPVGVVATDPDGTVTLWNEGMERIFGWSEDEVIGEPYPAVPEDRDGEDEAVRESVLDGESVSQVELVRETKDGELIDVSLSTAPVRDDAGEISEIVGFIQDVTERKERERELERTTDLLKRIQQMARVGGWELDVSTDPPESNWTDELYRLHGLPQDTDIDIDTIIEQYHPEDRERVRETIETSFEEGTGYDIEARLQPEPGETRWVRVIADAIYEDGEVVKYRGSIQDITEAKERERELAARSTAIEGSIDGIAILDENEEYTFVNQSHVEAYNYDSEEAFLGETWRMCYDDDEVERFEEEVIQELYETGSWRGEATGLRADGSTFPQELSLTVLDDGGLICVIRDITERKKRERELARFKRAVEASGHAIYMTDPDGTITYVNSAFEETTGYAAEEAVGQTPEILQSGEHDDAYYQDLWETVRNGEVWEEEITDRRKDGELYYAEQTIAPVTDERGEVDRLVAVQTDVTERKRREQEIQRTSELLEHSQRIAEVGGWTTDLSPDPPRETEWTNKMYDIFELPPDETPTAEEVMEYYHPDDREERRAAVERAIEDGESWDDEARLITAEGDERWVRTAGEPVYEDGEVVRLHGAMQDVTERKERERELERTRDLLQQAGRVARFGGWELDLTADPPEMIWSDELYDLHGVPRDADIGIQTTLDQYHPEDRRRMHEQFDRAIESGVGYDMEIRAPTDDGGVRWMRAIGEPVVEDGETVAIRGSIQDITEQKEREFAFQSLHEATRGLLSTETEADVAELVVGAADEVLDVAGVGVYLLDAASNRLEPVAHAGWVGEDGEPPAVEAGGDSLLWNTFVTGTPTMFDDTETASNVAAFGTDVENSLLVPIGDHGVFVVAAQDPTIDDETRRLVETLVATTEAAFDRIETEESLRERDAELESQNRRLRRQMQINDIIRRIDQSLIGATSRDEIETAVCERLVEAEPVSFAWIGALDAADETVEPRAWAGPGGEYLDAVSFALDEGAPEPAAITADSQEPTVVSNVVDQLKREPWRKTALAHDFHSVVSVPLVVEEYFYGVLTVYADEPDAFGDLERSVFAELGENIANSINAVETRQALHADTLVELTLQLDSSDDLLGRVAREAGCSVSFEGLATHSADETRLFFSVVDADPDAVQSILDGLVAVRDCRLVSGGDADEALFEVTVAGEVLPARLVRHGGTPRAIDVEGDEMTVVVDVPTATDVREFVETVREAYPSVELGGRRTVQRATHTRQELVSSLFETLTDRQLEVLRTAYFAGFFEWPRTSTGEDVAEMLDVTQPTVNRHLRLGQQRLLEQLFDESESQRGAES